jgi:hypothetical protein
MATPTEHPLLVGVFDEHRRAQRALQTLRKMGFPPAQLGSVVRHGELLHADGALRGVDVPEHDLTGGLIGLGVPVAEARALEFEFERGRTVVTVQPEQLAWVAERVLELAGAQSVQSWSPRFIT